jgi:hypothetical protein
MRRNINAVFQYGFHQMATPVRSYKKEIRSFRDFKEAFEKIFLDSTIGE